MATSDTDPERLKKLFAQAADIAASVPEPMQDAAFNRALDQLLGEVVPPSSEPSTDASKQRRRAKGETSTHTSGGAPGSEELPADQLIAQVNRTAYPEIYSASNVLDRALRVLRLSDEEFGIEFLTAPEISQILVEKFRLPATHQGVRQALDSKPQYVDTTQVRRGSRGRSVVAYRIMSPGTNFLDAGGSPTGQGGSTSSARPQASTTHKRKSTTRKRQSLPNQDTNANAKSSRAKSASTSKKGPKTALTELLNEGFFDEPRLIGDARERLRHKKGLTFTLQDLSPALVRLLREGSLDREQNDSGQYEYRRP